MIVYVYACVHDCMSVWVYAHECSMRVCMYATCMCMFRYILMYVYRYMCMCRYMGIFVYMYVWVSLNLFSPFGTPRMVVDGLNSSW